MKINIAIDGPSAAGKSTIADILACKLNYTHLDTGAMYRAVAYLVVKNNVSFDNEEMIVSLMKHMDLQMNPDGTVILDGEDITDKIRTNEMSMKASLVSKQENVRKELVYKQQQICKNGGYILDGRDIGTVVLKDAPVKIFLVASVEARAKRRYKQNQENNIPGDYQTILEDIIARDYQDSNRVNSPLKKADDAYVIDSSDLTIDEVINQVLSIINEKVGKLND